MPVDRALRDRLEESAPLVLDGATGTELERRGVRSELPLWSAHALLESPDVVRDIHEEYVASGADLLTANTFRTQRRSLARAGLAERARGLTGLAVKLARDAARAAAPRRVWVLGSAPPLEDCFRPDRVPEAADLEREHAEHAEHLAAAGADGVLVETMNTVREARAAARAARDVGLTALVCFTCAGGELLSGERLEPAIDAVAELDAGAIGINCLPPSQVAECLADLRASGLPFLVSPNLGAPQGDTRSEELGPARFASLAGGWLHAGARIVGGCCGTTPAHTREIARLLHTG